MAQFTEGFEEAGINWEEFAQTLPALINTTTEAMIAEIVDNALDQNCSKIKIELFGSSWNDLAVIIYDNGNGFIDEENMDASFELSNRPGFGGENSRIGKFNIGLKLTPLSRCCNRSFCSYQRSTTIQMFRQTSNQGKRQLWDNQGYGR